MQPFCYISNVENSPKGTFHVAYCDTLGKLKKCHCKEMSLYPMIFSLRGSFWDTNNCHCNQIVTITRYGLYRSLLRLERNLL